MRIRRRRVAMLVACALCSSGCVSRLTKGLAIGGVGLVIAGSALHDSKSTNNDGPTLLGIAGLAALIAACAITLTADAPAPPPDPEDVARTQAVTDERIRALEASHRDEAEVAALTKTAMAAAREGDCVTVANVRSRIEVLDPAVDEKLVHDVEIARCLTHPPAPP